MKILVTCPPMLRQIDGFRDKFKELGFDVATPPIVQTLSESALIELLPAFDGWIIGDDPATAKVFEAGAAGKLRAAVKWGIGVDNVDFEGARSCGIKITNTPGMFGAEVADLAMHYVTALARQTYLIDHGIRKGKWPKPTGQSLFGKTAAVVGYGDIGQSFAKRAAVAGMELLIYDPAVNSDKDCRPHLLRRWPEDLSLCDFVVLTCALTQSSRKIINQQSLEFMKSGVRIVNVSRGGLIDEAALIEALGTGHVHSVALDVFETEPPDLSSPLFQHPNCIFSSHNGSNTMEAVERATLEAIEKLAGFLGVKA